MAVIELERPETGVALVRMNRPERLNAINFELVSELHDALDDIAADDSCKVIVLTGTGRAFCRGLDLKEWGVPPAVGDTRRGAPVPPGSPSCPPSRRI